VSPSRRRVNADRRLKIFVRLSENGSRGPPTAAERVHRDDFNVTLLLYTYRRRRRT